jgi:hypothetical protein
MDFVANLKHIANGLCMYPFFHLFAVSISPINSVPSLSMEIEYICKSANCVPKHIEMSVMASLLGISKGLSWLCRSTTNNFLLTPEAAEALAAFHAVETCKEMSFHDIILDGDSLQIVNAIKATCNNLSSFGHIVDGIKLELRPLRSWRIEHVKRDANVTAHTIEKETILGVIDRIWVE